VRGGACGEAARLEHHEALAAQPRLADQGERHPRGLAGTGWRLEHGHAARGERGAEGGESLLDGEGRQRHCVSWGTANGGTEISGTVTTSG